MSNSASGEAGKVGPFAAGSTMTKLVYLSRQVMDDVGRKLNAERGAKIEAQARAEIKSWEESRSRSDRAKQARISKLSQIL